MKKPSVPVCLGGAKQTRTGKRRDNFAGGVGESDKAVIDSHLVTFLLPAAVLDAPFTLGVISIPPLNLTLGVGVKKGWVGSPPQWG